MEEISSQRQRIMSTILELAQQQNASNVDVYNAKKLKSKIKFKGNSKYNEWLKCMAKTEYQCRRGYSKAESETETEEENILSTEVPSEVAPASDLKIAFIQSPNQICDIKQVKRKVKNEKDDDKQIDNIWKNRLRFKGQNK